MALAWGTPALATGKLLKRYIAVLRCTVLHIGGLSDVPTGFTDVRTAGSL